MKTIYPLKATPFLLMLLVFCLGMNHKAFTEVNYHFTYDLATPDIIKIELYYEAQSDTLYMGGGASQFPDRWAKFIDIDEIKSDNHIVEDLVNLGDARWIIPHAENKNIRIGYTINLDHEKHEWPSGIDGAVYRPEDGLFFTGRSMFIVPAGINESINISFSLPEHWRLTVPWEADGTQPFHFQMQNSTSLIESIAMAGIYEEMQFKRGDFELVFAIGKPLESQKEVYRQLSEGVLDYYINLMGGIPNPPPQQILKRSVVIVNPYNATDGEVIGNHISMVMDSTGDPMSQMLGQFIFAHEFFHLWNGKSIQASDLRTEWFKEGFTNFYTLKALVHVGILNEAGYFGVLNNLFYQRYINDDGTGILPLVDGEEKHDHWGLIYGGGLFVAIAQDISIRMATDNTKSLDNLFRDMFLKLGGTNNAYTLQELNTYLSELNESDQSDFFDTYIQGHEIIPIESYLKKAGLSVQLEENQLKVSSNDDSSPTDREIVTGFTGLTD